MKSPIVSCAMILTLALGALNAAYADSATWNATPVDNDWSNPANWTPETVPNGPTDVATFAGSSVTGLKFSAEMTEVAEIVFNPGANRFKISADSKLAQTNVFLTISGAGITNNSGVTQDLVSGPTLDGEGTGIIEFLNAATAGNGTAITALGSVTDGAFSGSEIHFYDTSTAGSATIVAEGARGRDDAGGGEVFFHDNATAANANVTVTNSLALGGGSGEVHFDGFSSASDAIFNVAGGEVVFAGDSEAATAQFVLPGGEVDFFGNSSAADASFVMDAGLVNFWDDTVTAGNSLFIINGGVVQFFGGTAGNATLIANTGTNGGHGSISFQGSNDGGEARIEVVGEGTLDIGTTGLGFVSVGSIEGDGLITLGTNELITGANNLSTTFSGVIEEPGSLAKIGTGMLTLSGANTYTRGTVVNEGTLRVANTSGSGTGSRDVEVNAGALAGNGIIAGSVTVGTGSGTGAFLAPGAGAKQTNRLTIRRALTIKADGTYSYRVKTKTTQADQVIANGVTIESGAQFSFTQLANKQLTAGTVFTAIDNISANPITGTFANLLDGSTFTSGRNTYQADYEGGDGNDLTLTVVP